MLPARWHSLSKEPSPSLYRWRNERSGHWVCSRSRNPKQQHGAQSSGLYHPNTAQCQAWSHPMVKNQSSTNSGSQRVTYYIWRYETWNLQGQHNAQKKKHCLMMRLWKLKMNPIFYPIIKSFHLPATVFKSPPKSTSWMQISSVVCPHLDCTDVSEDKYHRCPESKWNWNYTSNNTSQLSVLIFKCTQTKSSVPLKSKKQG